jgi:hypothetical protein
VQARVELNTVLEGLLAVQAGVELKTVLVVLNTTAAASSVVEPEA